MALFLSWREIYSSRQQAREQYAAAAAAVALIAAAADANVILPMKNMRPLENFLTGYHNRLQKSNYLVGAVSLVKNSPMAVRSSFCGSFATESTR